MVNLLLKELIKLYFACIAVFGVKTTNDQPMSLSTWNRQLLGEKKYQEIQKSWGLDSEGGGSHARAK